MRLYLFVYLPMTTHSCDIIICMSYIFSFLKSLCNITVHTNTGRSIAVFPELYPLQKNVNLFTVKPGYHSPNNFANLACNHIFL